MLKGVANVKTQNNKEHDVPSSTGAKGEASLRGQGRGPYTIGTRSVIRNPVPVHLISKMKEGSEKSLKMYLKC